MVSLNVELNGQNGSSSSSSKSPSGRPNQDQNNNINGKQQDQHNHHRMDEKEIEMQPLKSDMSFGEDYDSPDQRGEKLLHPIEVEFTDEYGPEQDDDAAAKKAWNLEDWLYPPHLPRSCQLLRKENIAIPACYLLVGILQGLSGPLINVYPLDLGATEAQQTTLSTIKSLPASFKLLFGFLSDNVPINGYRRKSYMIIGWGLAAASMFSLRMFCDLTMGTEQYQKDDGTFATRADPPDGAPSIPFLSLSFLLFGTGYWMADVMGDSVVAEKAKLEPPDARGSTQSSCYSYRFFGSMCAAPISTVIYSKLGPSYVIVLLALFPLSILPLVWWMGEVQNGPVASTKDQCNEIWQTVCSRSVWQPLSFVYIYNVLQVSNAAWRQYLKTVLDFTSNQLNTIYVLAGVLIYLGILVYKYYLIKYSWRAVYVVTTFLNGFFSILQVLLIYGITFGLSPFLFALGDDAFAEFIQGIQFLPTTIMMVHLCPAGSEGASYAMFTTVHNSAGQLSAAISSSLLGIWDVSKAALENNDLTGMVRLTFLTTALQVSGILFVGLLPQTVEDLFQLREQSFGSSRIGGFIFLSLTFASILWAIFVGIMNVISPGWMGES